MDTLTIRQKLYEYIKIADDEKVEAIYTILKDDKIRSVDWWEDKDLVTELKKRSANLKNGNDKGFSLERSQASLSNRQNNG